MINYNNKKFRAVSNSENGAVDEQTIFHYFQNENILTCTYIGNSIKHGHLIGIVDENGNISMRYHQINANGELMTGICNSTAEIMENGKIRLYEKWQWTSGDLSKGESVLEEI